MNAFGEPWRYVAFSKGQATVFDDNYSIVAEAIGWDKAKRIVACVNAMAGIVQPDRVASAIRKSLELLENLPSGIDYEADTNNVSPDDMTAHIAGLIWQQLKSAEDGGVVDGS